MRMLEQILTEQDPPPYRSQQLRDALAQSEIFDVTNVAEYLYAQSDQEVWDVKTAFPCLAPPFPSFWMEYGRPSRILSCEHGIRSNEGLVYRTGLWFDYSELTEANKNLKNASFKPALQTLADALNKEMTPEIEEEWKAILATGAHFMDLNDHRWDQLSVSAMLARTHLLQYATYERLATGGLDQMFGSMDKLGVKWVASCASFIQIQRNSRVLGPLGWQRMFIDGNGNVVEVTYEVNLQAIHPDAWCKRGEGFSTIWFPALLAISFCHCKNVTIKSEEGAPAKLRKRQAERGRQHVTYKILEITPMKAVLKNAGAESPKTGLRRALHICRGHFANYDEKGLFGKLLGRFWIPQHIRGTMDKGVVVKDYAVNSPEK